MLNAVHLHRNDAHGGTGLRGERVLEPNKIDVVAVLNQIYEERYIYCYRTQRTPKADE